MLLDYTNITEFDFNPLVVDNVNSIHAVDVRIKVGAKDNKSTEHRLNGSGQ